ncbi:MAG TPA: DUF3800 domain-containing protein [Chitinophagales bacterium]
MSNKHKYHRFLDEAGDTTFFGRNKLPLVLGSNGVSKYFILGMLQVNEPIDGLRAKIRTLQTKVEGTKFYNQVPSVKKLISKGGFYFHAKNDIPELRKEFFDFILTLDCSIEIIVAEKDVERFVSKHNRKDAEFYAELLAQLLKDKLDSHKRLALNIAGREGSTGYNNLQVALEKATAIYKHHNPSSSTETMCNITFNVQPFSKEPILSVTDYLCWAVQRYFEKDEARFYDYLQSKIERIVDLYGGVIYTAQNPLPPKNEISP